MESLRGTSRVVFDLDGTIYDTRDYERPALAAVVAFLCEKSGGPLPGAVEALWARRQRDRHRPGLFDEVLAQHGLPPTWGPECLEQFHSYPGLELETTDSLHDELTTLRKDKCALALVSNGKPSLQERKLLRLGITGLFDRCIFCDPREPDQLKPTPWAWTQLAEWRSGEATVYVGDDPVDAAFAAAGGSRFVEFRFRNPAYAD